ncbi:MAG: ABC transporter ATP-binding protein, partial [Pseudomonadota bacterium]
KEVIGDPQHEYTRLLIDSIPWPEIDRGWGTPTTEAEDAARLDRLAADHRTVTRGDIPGFALSAGAPA